jgi:glycerophosphoryl diester phosphodiesterase
MRLFLISFTAVLLTGLIILGARIWGMGQTFADYPHAFLDGAQPLVIVRADTLQKISDAVKLKADVVIWADVRVSQGKVPFVLPSSRDVDFLKFKEDEQLRNPTTRIMMGPKLSDYTWEQINEFYKETPALKEIYEQFPNTRFILNIVDNVADVHTSVVDAIKDFNPDNRTLIQSDALVILDAIKDMKPQWVYGTSTPDIMRLLSFDSIYILPATQFKGDVFIAPFKILKRPAFNDDVVEEMRRRHRKVFLGPIETPEQFAKAKELKADGFITDDLSAMLKLLGMN